MNRRGSGILLHISSLPSPFGIGDCGPVAYRFADFLQDGGQSYWQILPLTPTTGISGHSPYSSLSSFAGNPLFISPQLLCEQGLLQESDLEVEPAFPEHHVDFSRVTSLKSQWLHKAYSAFQSAGEQLHAEFKKFRKEHRDWLDDYAMFVTFKDHFGDKAWSDWPAEIRDREPDAVTDLASQLSETVQFHRFVQFIFYRQWTDLKEYCNDGGIRIVGDIPYYVSYDSADVWTNQELFKLDSRKKPTYVGGVPPDYFSETGQRWGNPVYRWDIMRRRNYEWWISRLNQNAVLYDTVRIDHFRGFIAYWEIPAAEETAVNGEWMTVPTDDFFTTIQKYAPALDVIAEDLGVITPEVRETIRKYDFPGMRILQFAFDDELPVNPYAPHNHIQHCVLYTGTHDNNTVRGWYENDIDAATRERLRRYLGHHTDANQIHNDFIRMGMRSVANTVIIPLQDILGLGGDARMNIPGTAQGNWEWRVSQDAINPEVSGHLRKLTEFFGRKK
ncbi:MAG: 4-alpha-glucanotransferase [Candidatus Marinimicrobia bacterium]|nr:4-alpha-glucanotransferase [Candidatus Neomarinimicrobiota bacterium]MCF7827869.1 4-alpha-glucanotransferase [Candidatus Neomarinimicrobiota bacterium]MCF7879376.1 4-alpha-glucanotransferase [Candidatus Neomarinimicrobiota bacterium]